MEQMEGPGSGIKKVAVNAGNGWRDKTQDFRLIYEAQSGKMIADSSTDPEILCEAIHENHSEVDEFAFYHNASMGEVMDSHDQSLSNVETSATPRSDSNLSSTCGDNETTKRASHTSQGDPDSDKDSLNSCSQSLEKGTPNRDNGSTDTCTSPNKKCNTLEDKSEQITDEELCPTRANLPPSEDTSIKSASSKPKLRASAKPASSILEDYLLGNNLGDECQNQHDDCKRRADFAELQPSSTVQNYITHEPLQETKYDQESSEDTPIKKKAIIDAQAHNLIATERGINMRGKSNGQETTDHDVSAVYRGEESENTSEEDNQQEHVSQPVQATSRDWEAPVIVHGGLVRLPNNIVEQPPPEESSPSFPRPTEEQEGDHSSSEIVFSQSSLGKSSVPPTLSTSNPSNFPLVLPSHIPLTSQGIRENAVTYCSVSNHDITCQLRTVLHQVRVRLPLVEIRFNCFHRRLLASPSRIDCVLLRQVHCHIRRIVYEVQVIHDRYHCAQLQFQCIQALSLHSNCRPQHAECLRQLQRSFSIRTCQGLRSTSLLLDRVSRLLSTIFHQLQRPNNVMAVVPPPAPIVHIPRQPATQLASLTSQGNIQPFQVQVEEETKDLVSNA